MPFVQEKIDRSVNQSRGIFNKYVYRTTDTMEAVQAPGYFSQCRFAVIDGPSTNSNGWHEGIIEAHCADGYVIGRMDAGTGTLNVEISAPGNVAQIDRLVRASFVNQVPDVLGTPIQVSFGAALVGTHFDLAANGDITCKVSGNYRVVFFLQAGRTGSGGIANIYFRLLINGTQVGDSVLARLDNAATIVPLRFNLNLDLVAGQVIAVQAVQDSSGVAAGGLYSTTPATAGWNQSPSASVDISDSLVNY